MTSLLDLYQQQFKTSFAAMSQYRAAMAIWLIGHILEPLIYLVIWSVVARTQGGSVGGFNTREFAAYFILLMLVNHITYTWIMYEYEYRVRHGSLSFALLRPVHPIHADIADNVSSKIITLPGIVLSAIILAIIFKPIFNTSIWAIMACFPALALAFFLRFLLEWCLALMAFWTTRVSAVNQIYFVAMLFLSGQIAPLSLLPSWAQVAAAILPFRWMISFPLEIMLGRLSSAAILTGTAVQIVWVSVGLVLIKIVWRAGVRQYSAVGG